MVDALTPNSRQVLRNIVTPIFNKSGSNFRIIDKFVKKDKKKKKNKLNNDKTKLVDGGKSTEIFNSKSYDVYNPIKLNNSKIVVNKQYKVLRKAENRKISLDQLSKQ